MKKKLAVMLLCAAAGTGLITGCGSSGAEQAPDPVQEETVQEEPSQEKSESETTEEETTEASEALPSDGEDPLPDGWEVVTEAPEGGWKIACVSSGIYHQFGMAIRDGLEAAAGDYGVQMTFDGPETDAEIDKQLDMLKIAIDQHPDAIVLNSIDPEALNSEVQRAESEGIPVIICCNGVSDDWPICNVIAGDEKTAGALAADQMGEALGEAGGQVGLVCADQTSNWSAGRRDGFIERCEEKYPNIEIVDVQYSGGDHLKATDCTKAIISAYPDLKGLFGNGEGNMVGIVNAINELGASGKYTIVGFDSGAIQLNAIKNGMIIGGVTQDPYGMGYYSMKAAVCYLESGEVPSQIDTGFYWYNTENMNDEKIARMLYE